MRDADLGEISVRLFASFRARLAEHPHGAEHHVFPCGHMAPEIELLEHHRYAGPQAGERSGIADKKIS
ncbi:hypothetical protein D3C72_2160810 [compost metagenome]